MDEIRGDLCDVAMGAYDVAEICELVGVILDYIGMTVYQLEKIKKKL